MCSLRSPGLLVILLVFGGCDEHEPRSGGDDAGPDETVDAALDAAVDPAVDVAFDASAPDASSPVEATVDAAAAVDAVLDASAPDASMLIDDASSQPDAATRADAAVDASAASDDGAVLRPCAIASPTGGGLLDLVPGGPSSVQGDRVLVGGSTARLWEPSSGRLVAQLPGESAVAFQRQTLLLTKADGSPVVRSAADGTLLATLPAQPAQTRLGLSSDGSYVWAANASSLSLWSRTGGTLTSLSGAYQNAVISAQPNAVYVASGAAGADVIETLTLDGTRTVSVRFAGMFVGWFADAPRFTTQAVGPSSVIRVYGSDARIVRELSVGYVSRQLGGSGNMIWTLTYDTLRIYDLAGGIEPSLSAPVDDTTQVGQSSAVLGAWQRDVGQLRLIDLTRTLVVDTVSLPTAGIGSFNVDGLGNLVVTDSDAVVWHQPPTRGTPRALSCGTIKDMSLSNSGAWAVATSANQLLLGNLDPPYLRKVIPFNAGKVRLSEDGRVLVARADAGRENVVAGEIFHETDRSVRIYDGDGNLIRTIASTYVPNQRYVADFTLADSGARVGIVWCTPIDGNWPCDYELSDPAGTDRQALGSVAFPYSSQPILLSPDGRHAAIYVYDPGGNLTRIYADGQLVASPRGMPFTWVGNDGLLIGNQGFIVVDPVGREKTRLPQLSLNWYVDAISETRVYQRHGEVYELATGARVWQEPAWDPSRPAAASATRALYITADYRLESEALP